MREAVLAGISRPQRVDCDLRECQLDLFADRTSATTMRANQMRI
jgi:hypothetical protein